MGALASLEFGPHLQAAFRKFRSSLIPPKGEAPNLIQTRLSPLTHLRQDGLLELHVFLRVVAAEGR